MCKPCNLVFENHRWLDTHVKSGDHNHVVKVKLHSIRKKKNKKSKQQTSELEVLTVTFSGFQAFVWEILLLPLLAGLPVHWHAGAALHQVGANKSSQQKLVIVNQLLFSGLTTRPDHEGKGCMAHFWGLEREGHEVGIGVAGDDLLLQGGYWYWGR